MRASAGARFLGSAHAAMSPLVSRRLARVVLGAALAALAAAAPATAQRTLTVAVTDAADGAPLTGATLVAPDLRHAAFPDRERGAAAGLDGVATLTDLPADTVRVVVSFAGFEPHAETVDLRAGDVRLGVALQSRTLDEVVVREGALDRDVRAVAVVEGAELDARRGQTLAETLDGLAGVSTLSTGPTIGKPVVRGLHSDRVVILEDGVRQEGQAWGGEHAPEIDPFAAGRVEVIRGAAGVEVGAGAIGGAVKLRARDLPTEPGLGGRLALQAFSNSGQGAASLALEDAPAGWGGVAWRAQGSLRRAGDARTPDVVISNSAFAEASGHLTAGYRRGETELDVHLRRYHAELGIYRGSHFGNLRNLEAIIERGGPDPDWDYGFSYGIDAPKQVVTHDVASVHGHTELGGGHLDAQLAWQENRRREFDAHRPYSDSLAALGDRPSFDLGLGTQSLDLAFAPRPSSRLAGKVGLQARTQLNKNAASGVLVPNYRAYDGGVFGHATWAATPRLSLEAGARLDARQVTAFPFAPGEPGYTRDARAYLGGALALGALQTLGDAWSVALHAGSAWRPPNVAELYSDGVHHGTAQYEIGDPTLDSEHSLDLSATLRHESDAASAELSGYVNHVFGYVYALDQPEPTVTIRGTFPTLAYTSADARLAGVDADAELRPASWLAVGVHASLLRADNLDLDGPLHGVPANRFGAHARATAPRPVLSVAAPFVELDVRHTARQDRLQPGAFLAAPFPPAYTLASLRLGGEVSVAGQPAQLQLGVDNLFDVRYRDALSRFRYFVDEPGRNVSVRLSVPLGSR